MKENDMGMSPKTLGNTDVNAAKKNVSDLVVFGNGDLFKLISKASSQSEGWMKSTKAMDVGIGCFVQITTQQRNPDGSYTVGEGLAYAAGIYIAGEGESRSLKPILPIV